MSIEQMKAYLLKAYPYPKWEARVNKMSDRQIAATYSRVVQTKVYTK